MGNGIDDVRKTHEEGFVAIKFEIEKKFGRLILYIFAMTIIFGISTIALQTLGYDLYSNITLVFLIVTVIFNIFLIIFKTNMYICFRS